MPALRARSASCGRAAAAAMSASPSRSGPCGGGRCRGRRATRRVLRIDFSASSIIVDRPVPLLHAHPHEAAAVEVRRASAGRAAAPRCNRRAPCRARLLGERAGPAAPVQRHGQPHILAMRGDPQVELGDRAVVGVAPPRRCRRWRDARSPGRRSRRRRRRRRSPRPLVARPRRRSCGPVDAGVDRLAGSSAIAWSRSARPQAAAVAAHRLRRAGRGSAAPSARARWRG